MPSEGRDYYCGQQYTSFDSDTEQQDNLDDLLEISDELKIIDQLDHS